MADDVLQRALDFALKTHTDTARRYAWELREMYEGDQEQFIQRRPNEPLADFADRPKEWLNLTRRVIDVQSRLYKEDAKRTFLTDSGETDRRVQQRMDAVYRANVMAPLLQLVDRMARLQGSVAVRPLYHTEPGDPRQGQVEYVFYHREKLDVLTDDRDPTTPAAVVVRWRSNNRDWVEVWTSQTVVTLRSRRQYTGDAIRLGRAETNELVQVGRQENRYGILPFAFFHNELPVDVPLATPGGRNLVELNKRINDKLSDLAYIALFQAHGQWYVKGSVPPEWKPVTGPNRLIKVPADGDLGVIAPVVDFEAYLAYINGVINLLLLAEGVPQATVRMDQSAARSGVAIIAEQLPLIEDRQQRRELFRLWERTLAIRTMRVLQVEEGLSVPDRDGDVHFQIDFADPRLPLPDPDERIRWQWEIEQHAATIVDYMLTRNPDLTRAQAERQFLDNLQFNHAS